MPLRHRRFLFALCTRPLVALPTDVWHMIVRYVPYTETEQSVYHSHCASAAGRPPMCHRCDHFEARLRLHFRRTPAKMLLQRLTAPLPRSPDLRMDSHGSAWPYAESKWFCCNIYVHPTGFELAIILDGQKHWFWWPGSTKNCFLQVFAQTYLANILLVKMPCNNHVLDAQEPRLFSLDYRQLDNSLVVKHIEWPFQEGLGLHAVKCRTTQLAGLYGPIKSFIYQQAGRDVASIEMKYIQ